MPKDKCSLPSSSRKPFFFLQQMEIITGNHKQSKLWSPIPTDTSTIQLSKLRLRKHCEKGVERLQEPEGVCCEIVSSRKVICYPHKVSPTQLTKNELSSDSKNRLLK